MITESIFSFILSYDNGPPFQAVVSAQSDFHPLWLKRFPVDPWRYCRCRFGVLHSRPARVLIYCGERQNNTSSRKHQAWVKQIPTKVDERTSEVLNPARDKKNVKQEARTGASITTDSVTMSRAIPGYARSRQTLYSTSTHCILLYANIHTNTHFVYSILGCFKIFRCLAVRWTGWL